MAKKTSIIDNLLDFPWWFHFLFSFSVLVSPFFILPYLHKSNNFLVKKIEPQFNTLTYIVSVIFIILSLICLYKKWERKNLFNHQNNLKDLYALTWQQFESLTHEVFVRAGYKVQQRGGNKADGGIDLLAYRSGMKTIIQCKHWKSKNVGVAVVREMFGVGMHEKANEVYILTCGYFTKDAKEFAEGKAIHLISGYKLLEWIKELN